MTDERLHTHTKADHKKKKEIGGYSISLAHCEQDMKGVGPFFPECLARLNVFKKIAREKRT